MRISTRLTATFLVASVLAVVLAAFFFSRTSVRIAEQNHRRALRDTGAVLLPQARMWLTSPGFDIDQAVDATAEGLDIRLTVIDTTGIVLGDSQRSGTDLRAMENHAQRPEIRSALGGNPHWDIRTSATLGIQFLYTTHPVIQSGHPVGVLRLAAPLTGVRTLENLRVRYLGAGLAAVLAASLLLAAFLSTWFSRPMHRLQDAADAISQGDYDHPIAAVGGGEIGELRFSIQRIADSLKQARERLDTEGQVQAAVFAGLQDGLIALDRDGSVLSANPTAADLLGEPGDLAGRDVFELFREPEVTGQITRALAGEHGDEATLDRPPSRILRVSAVPVASAGGRPSALLVVADVTAYETTLRMRRDFLSNASHELRTPLTSIVGYLEALEDQLPADSPLHSKYLEVLGRQAARMRSILDDLLLIAQIESDQWPVEAEPYDLTRQVKQLIEHFEPAAAKRHQSLNLEAVSEPLRVLADREKMHVVLSNLIDNAVKYAGESGRIDIRLKPHNGDVRITVADNGPGIPRELTERIFERFYRLDRSRSRELGGTGLGLSIVRNILAAHRVQIEVDSDLGQGAEFSFTLPAQSA